MPKYKLHYFNVRARAETIRILLAYAGADWEDIRVTDFKTKKESGAYPFGQLPLLEVDGVGSFSQSMAILRYLAREFGLLPETSFQTGVADSIVDQIQDCTLKIISMWWEKDSSKQEEMRKNITENVLPQNIKFFDQILKANCQEKTFFFGDKITYADIHVFNFLNGIIGEHAGELEVPNELKDYPALVELYNGVMNEPKILAYLKSRPSTVR